MKLVLVWAVLVAAGTAAVAVEAPARGTASWYGEAHRGRLMANRQKFDPDKLVAASWFYPLGTKVQVSVRSGRRPPRSVLVTITDRGPARDLVRAGRIIDLSHAAFSQVARPEKGLTTVRVRPVR